ncbi:MAG: hypothetical protein GY940_04890, partial [bacterium]|nr:hypothetical protein [bacterium]
MKNKIDCLLIGHNEPDFREYHEEIKKLGEGSGVYRNLDLSFLTIEGKPYTIDEIFNMYLGSPDADDPSFQPMDPIRQGETFTATIGYLGNFLHRHGHSFDYVNSFQEEKEQLAVKLTENEVLTVAITTTLYGAPLPILRIIEFVKKYNKTAKIIVGGPYVFTQYRAQEKMVLEYLLGGMKGVDFFIISS